MKTLRFIVFISCIIIQVTQKIEMNYTDQSICNNRQSRRFGPIAIYILPSFFHTCNYKVYMPTSSREKEFAPQRTVKFAKIRRTAHTKFPASFFLFHFPLLSLSQRLWAGKRPIFVLLSLKHICKLCRKNTFSLPAFERRRRRRSKKKRYSPSSALRNDGE